MREYIMSILRANEIAERVSLISHVVSTLEAQRVPVCRADVDKAITEMIEDGTIETWEPGDLDQGRILYELAHCGHDTPQECIDMGCQQQYPGVL